MEEVHIATTAAPSVNYSFCDTPGVFRQRWQDRGRSQRWASVLCHSVLCYQAYTSCIYAAAAAVAGHNDDTNAEMAEQLTLRAADGADAAEVATNGIDHSIITA